VEGRLQLDQWTDKETQKPRSKMRVVAERTQFLGSAGRSNDNEQNDSYPRARQQQPDVNQGQQPYAPPEPTTAPAQPPQASNAGFGGQQQFPAPPPTAPPPTQTAPGSFQTQQQPPPQTAQSTEAFNPKVEGSEDDIPF
ncbi:MAG: hypothetical protein GXP32_09725, partial [Kiritimatiellaeota bacterium]|nr:hypothetical protein [Kiritimatiellota bacterium]